ncbi:MAG: hypothetical protein IOD09_07075 [Rhodocyclaceae bacterium]|nr:hypothetical protein [Rhodocyclaceae bacterium]
MSQPLILDAIAAAALIGISERGFHYVRGREDFPKPISVLSPRRPRWRRADLEEWVATRPPMGLQPEPARLALARDRRVVAPAQSDAAHVAEEGGQQ